MIIRTFNVHKSAGETSPEFGPSDPAADGVGSEWEQGEHRSRTLSGRDCAFGDPRPWPWRNIRC
jgi:hypothetical protein